MGAVAISHESFDIPLSICRGLKRDPDRVGRRQPVRGGSQPRMPTCEAPGHPAPASCGG